MNEITPEIVKQKVADIAAAVSDDETAHIMEDALHQDVLDAIANGALDAADAQECALQALRTQKISFSRWCAAILVGLLLFACSPNYEPTSSSAAQPPIETSGPDSYNPDGVGEPVPKLSTILYMLSGAGFLVFAFFLGRRSAPFAFFLGRRSAPRETVIEGPVVTCPWPPPDTD